MLQGLLFDLGDTLIDFEPMDTRAVFQIAAQRTWEHLVSLGHTPPSFARYRRAQYRAVRWAYLWSKLRRRDFNGMHLMARLCRRWGIQLDAQTLLELAWRWYAPIIDYTTVADDVAPTLTELRDRGLKLGLVSNTFVPGAVLDRHLELAGLLDLLPVRIYSADVGYRKPSRRIFQEALRLLDLPPSDVAFVGDLVKTDIVGARQVGMTTILRLPYSGMRNHRIADFVIRRIGELPELVAAITSTGGACRWPRAASLRRP